MRFSYRYLKEEGGKGSATVEAADEREARERLRQMGRLILSLRPSHPRKEREDLSEEILITFTTQLAGLLKAGIALFEALLSLEEQYRKERFHPLLLALCEKIKQGKQLSAALAAFPKSFSQLYLSMVASGEATGSLALALERLALLLSKKRALKRQLLGALLYPALLSGFSLLVVSLLFLFVIPSIEELFADRPVNGFTQMVMGASHLFRRLGPWCALLLGGAVGAFVGAWRNPEGRKRIYRLLLQVPLVNRFLIQAAVVRFARTLATLQQGGVHLLDALKVARESMYNPILEEEMQVASERVVAGEPLSLQLKRSALFPPLMMRMVFVGEQGGNVGEMLQRVADLYETEMEKSLARMQTLAQPLLLVFLGVIVGVIMLAVLLPLTDVTAFIEGG